MPPNNGPRTKLGCDILQSLSPSRDNQVHKHAETNKVICSFSFQRRQCLQPLHAFKGNNDHCLHFKDDNVFSHCMPSKVTMTIICISKMTMSSVIACLQSWQLPSFAFWRWQCLQSLHNFKGDNDHYFHFEDDNVFSHCMPSKVTMTIICILKMTMSSIIACLQRWQWPSFAFRRRQWLQSLHASKATMTFIYILKATMFLVIACL